ncbi:DUF6713 family protein [Sphingobacterium tabacisoli]|uniref:DUF6713 family protein n=1 Tax=Sphingobacterium tabacisoli TaxID=2044855 RepID=A0ABW5L7I1_9SPHI|nr:DUF6713 family protein [Sphingobacterium tabacisoli]
MPNYFLFYLALSFFLAHEIDAVRCKEWRIFPLLELINEQLARTIFILAHVPLFFFLSIQLSCITENESFMWYMDIFFVVHMLMHIGYLKHKNNKFKDWLSWLAIGGAGIFACLDLVCR